MGEHIHSTLFYVDANNLYGWAMKQPLPYGGYKWVKKGNDCVLKSAERQMFLRWLEGQDACDIDWEGKRADIGAVVFFSEDMGLVGEFLANLSDDDPVGYLLDVDVEYPTSLHPEHADFPFFPETKIPEDKDEHYFVPLFKRAGVSTAFKTEKLICDLTDKKVRVPIHLLGGSPVL